MELQIKKDIIMIKQIIKLRDKHQAVVSACNLIIAEFNDESEPKVKHSAVLRSIKNSKKKHYNQTAAGRKKLSEALKAYWKKKRDNQ